MILVFPRKQWNFYDMQLRQCVQGTRSEVIGKSTREPSMRCSRAGAKLLKFARAAIFRPDMINSVPCCRERVVRAARARDYFFKKPQGSSNYF